MGLNTILSTVAVIISTIVGLIVGIAYWKGRTDSELVWLKQTLENYKDAKVLDRVTRMETKFEFVWNVFVEQLLTHRPHLATKSSPLKPTEQGVLALSEVMGCLQSKSINLTDQVLYDIPQQIGIEKLREISERHEVTLGELLALVSLELGSNNHCGDEGDLGLHFEQKEGDHNEGTC